MDNVIQFPNSRPMIPGWDLACSILKSGDDKSMAVLQEFLDSGYEPFAITAFPQASPPNLVTGKSEVILIEKVWFKRPVAPVPAELPDPGPQLA